MKTCAFDKQTTFVCILPKRHSQPCSGYLPGDTLWKRVVTSSE